MRNSTVPTCLAIVFAIILTVPAVNAEWVESGIEVCTEPGDQYGQQIISDGAGGAIVVWEDHRIPGYEVFCQRFDSNGNILWTSGGVNISALGSNQMEPCLTTDGAGGAIIAYQSDRGDNGDIMAQRIRSNGSLAWTTGGVNVCVADNTQYGTRIISDGEGGAIITWADQRSGADYDIYASRIDSTGMDQWTSYGVVVCQASDDQWGPEITTDGNHGSIIVWEDARYGNPDIFIQKIDQYGNYAWNLNGNLVTNSSNQQIFPEIVSDMNGGAVVTWMDYWTGVHYDIKAERFLSDGTATWLAGTGWPVCGSDGDQQNPALVSDGAGGAIITWIDRRSEDDQIYAQHIDYAKGVNWAVDGIPVCLDTGDKSHPEIVSDGFNGAIILWSDLRYQNNGEIFGQRITSGGIAKWQEDGLNLTDYPAEQGQVKAVATGEGGIIVAWWDLRTWGDYNIYAQLFDIRGYWGDPSPVITDASDIPGDQGGKIRITWSPARMDDFPEEIITHYTVWQSVSEPAAATLLQKGVNETPLGSVGLDFEGPAYRFEMLGGVLYAWEWIASIEAHYWEEYAYTCATLQDSTASCAGMHLFVISANTADQFTFWDSDPDSGYSVDNLAPCAPVMLAGEQSFIPEGLNLTWAPNTEQDLDSYSIYRGTNPDFDPDPGNLLVSQCDTFCFDGEWNWDSGYCYKVAAVDIHGNSSDYSLFCSSEVTGDNDPPVPLATYIEQNYPNPFNPRTAINFSMKERGHVSINIYNIAGQLVKTLVNDTRKAGSYTTHWDGSNNNEMKVASGIYFYKMESMGFRQVKKMVLLR